MWWWHWWHLIQHWLAYMTGSLNTPGAPPNYNFWSGAGSDLGEVTLLGGLIAVYRRHNCHTRWCFRLGHHDLTDPDTGLTHRLCRAHHPAHPGRPLTARHITAIHHQRRGGSDVRED